MATYEVAWTSFDEHERGSLEQGKIADLVVLNQNPLKMDPKDLLKLKADQLYLFGKTYKPKLSIFNAIISGVFVSNRNI
jgi:predicted amidohydrolase YtcJ